MAVRLLSQNVKHSQNKDTSNVGIRRNHHAARLKHPVAAMAPDFPRLGSAFGDWKSQPFQRSQSMKSILTHTPLLTPQQIGELTSSLDNTHAKVLKAIDRLNKDIATKKSAIASRWENVPIDKGDRTRIEQREWLLEMDAIRNNSKGELDRLFKEAGAAYYQIIPQRLYYDSPVKVLSRQGLGDARRTDYTIQLQHAGPAEIASMGQLAIGSGNSTLAAVVLSRLDAMPVNHRPFGAHHLAANVVTDFAKVNEYLKLAEVRFQGVVLAIRAWSSGVANPINTISLALRERQLDKKILKELENDRQQ